MDKLSAALIGVICLLLGIDGALIGSSWSAGGSHDRVLPADAAGMISQQEQIREEMQLTVIALNGDTQVINGGGREIWIRASIAPQEKAGGRVSVSWKRESDGYYYYRRTVAPGRRSDPLLCEETGSGELAGTEAVFIEAQAVQANWLGGKAETGMEAFALFSQNPLLPEKRKAKGKTGLPKALICVNIPIGGMGI